MGEGLSSMGNDVRKEVDTENAFHYRKKQCQKKKSQKTQIRGFSQTPERDIINISPIGYQVKNFGHLSPPPKTRCKFTLSLGILISRTSYF